MKDISELELLCKEQFIDFSGIEMEIEIMNELLQRFKNALSPGSDNTDITNIESKYIVEGLPGLSVKIYRLLVSGIGYFIMSYAVEYGANRLAEGFKGKFDLIHYAEWVLSKYEENTIDRDKKIMELLETQKDFLNEKRASMN